ncbi:MAG TPA: APC family permease [Kofleriaceae bacterium]|nr:APC family permease [Kofleriaceae bacterium]
MAEQLERVVGVPGAVLMGLGSILGTGIFVGVGLAAGVAGAWVLPALALAALVAACNGLSSAQLAAAFPVSGGTYEYGHRVLSRPFGLVAGWTFLIAKSASAATAALGFAGYALAVRGGGGAGAQLGLALAAVLVMTAVVADGLRRSNRTNAVIVSITIAALAAFVIAGLPHARAGAAHLDPLWRGQDPGGLLRAAALLFVAFTGYGRIATLGEEVREPARSIPRAIVIALVLTTIIYAAVAVVALCAAGPRTLAAATASTAAPLEDVASRFDAAWVGRVVAGGAITAMLGVLLNLLLGLSRVVLAMARRGDLPRGLAAVDARRSSPVRAVLVVGAVIATLVVIRDVKLTWTVSAFTVLVYYAITNLAALRLPAEQRRYPRAIAVVGLLGCLALGAAILAPGADLVR